MIPTEDPTFQQIDLAIVKYLLKVDAQQAPNKKARRALVGFLQKLELATADPSTFAVKDAEGVYHLYQ